MHTFPTKVRQTFVQNFLLGVKRCLAGQDSGKHFGLPNVDGLKQTKSTMPMFDASHPTMTMLEEFLINRNNETKSTFTDNYEIVTTIEIKATESMKVHLSNIMYYLLTFFQW